MRIFIHVYLSIGLSLLAQAQNIDTDNGDRSTTENSELPSIPAKTNCNKSLVSPNVNSKSWLNIGSVISDSANRLLHHHHYTHTNKILRLRYLNPLTDYPNFKNTEIIKAEKFYLKPGGQVRLTRTMQASGIFIKPMDPGLYTARIPSQLGL
jgi:hypothetical protein